MAIPFAEMKLAPFKTFEEIPLMTKEYIVYVSGEKTIEQIGLEEINGFMAMLYEAEQEKRAEYEDGWVF